MASVQKWKGDRWRASWRGPDGRSQSKVFDRKIDATRHLAVIEASKLTGTYVDPRAGKVTFRQFAEQWRAAQPHRRSTETKVRHNLENCAYPQIGDRTMAGLRTSHIQALVTRLSQDGLAPATVQSVYRTIASVCAAAIDDRIIAVSPCRRISLPRPDTGKVSPLATVEVHALVAAAPDRYRSLLIVGAWGGLRLGEALGLTVDRVDFLRRTIVIDRQLVRGHTAEPEFGPPKTPSSVRTIQPAPSYLLEALSSHIAQHPPGPDGLIFTNRDGRAVRSAAWTRQMQRIAATAKVDATFHDLRHYCASALIATGASIKGVQLWLGHASATVTLDVYGHLWPDSNDRMSAGLDSLAPVAQVLHAPSGEPAQPNVSRLIAVK